MHSGTGGGGFAAHTYTLGMKWIFNDMPINETEIIAYSWGRAGIPVIFASGDDRLKQQLEWMTWLEYVTVKTARGAGDAELRPFEEVHAEMTAAAERAVGSLENARAVRLTEPIKAQLNAVHPAGLEILEGVPGIDYRDRTVTFQAGDFLEAYNGVEALIGVATTRYMHLLQGVVRRQGDARAIFQDFAAELTKAWVEMESGERRPPSSPAAKAEPGAYFGVR